MRQAGITPETNQEMERMIRFVNSAQAQFGFLGASVRVIPTFHFMTHSTLIGQNNVLPDGTQVPHLNGHAPSQLNGFQPGANLLAAGQTPTRAYTPTPQSPVSFSKEQINALRIQIHAFKLLSRGEPIPEHIQRVLHPADGALIELEKLLQGPDVPARIVDAAVKMAASSEPPAGDAAAEPSTVNGSTNEVSSVKAEEQEDLADLPSGPFMEDNVDSGIYPYNAFVHPFTHLKMPKNLAPSAMTLYATRLQRLLVPSIMPPGLDPHQIIAERNRFIDARIEQRIRELSSLPVTMGDGGLDQFPLPTLDGTMESSVNKENDGEKEAIDIQMSSVAPNAHGKLGAIIELKSLRVREKQRALRAQIVERLNHGTLLPLDRKDLRRARRPTIRDARMTEQLERKQRADRERRAKQKHLEQLNVICTHGREMIAANRAHQDRILKLGRAVQALHAFTEKEEAKRIERISKERLKALKADDEEAYMKLIDTAKDTRITHLLRQTDSYLDSLAQAVVAQQNDDVHRDNIILQTEDGPADETMFGAQKLVDPEERTKIDYYAVAHKLTEKVSKQPALLVGGTLKDYQLKGLQWMVSLYNNRLNGILADEMVSD